MARLVKYEELIVEAEYALELGTPRRPRPCTSPPGDTRRRETAIRQALPSLL
jgi:hypothetical protein